MKYLQAPSDAIQTVRPRSNNLQKDDEIHWAKSWRSLYVKGRWLIWKATLDAVKFQQDEYEAADGSVAVA